MITEFTQFKKTITIPNLEKFIGKSRDEITEKAIVYLQNKFKERIKGQQVKIKTLWDQDIEGKVVNVIFHIHSNRDRGVINRITVKLYMEDGNNHNVRQGGKMYIIPEPPPRIRWFNRGELGERNW